MGDSDSFDITVGATWCRIFFDCMRPWISGPCIVRKKLNIRWVFLMFFRMYFHLLESRCSLRSPPSPVASSHAIIFILYCHHSYIFSLHARSWSSRQSLLCYQDASSLTWMTLFSKVRSLSSCTITCHYFRSILPPFLHIFTLRKKVIISSVFIMLPGYIVTYLNHAVL